MSRAYFLKLVPLIFFFEIAFINPIDLSSLLDITLISSQFYMFYLIRLYQPFNLASTTMSRGHSNAYVSELNRKQAVNRVTDEDLGNGAAPTEKIQFGAAGGYDTDVYGSIRADKSDSYLDSINTGDDDEEEEERSVTTTKKTVNYNAPSKFIQEAAKGSEVCYLLFTNNLLI